jgi:DNA-binding SARP family transcriptional activator
MRFEVLGPVRGWSGADELDLGSPQQRAVLAMLLLARGKQVSLDRIIGGLWGERAPRAATSAIRTYVSRLRRCTDTQAGRGSSDLIKSVGDGYVVPHGAAALDLDTFEEWLSEARAVSHEAVSHEAAHSVRLLRDALGLWRGTALAGIPGPHADASRVRLTELRMAAAEEKLTMDIALGEHAVAIAELRALLAEHSFREGLSVLLMLALYKSGRQAEALAVFDDVRQRLNAELGIDPGPALQAMHQRVLVADRRLMDLARVQPIQIPGTESRSLVA